MLAVGHAAYARKDWPAAMKAFQQSAEAGSAEARGSCRSCTPTARPAWWTRRRPGSG